MYVGAKTHQSWQKRLYLNMSVLTWKETEANQRAKLHAVQCMKEITYVGTVN